jgi:hypothetical protein
MGKEKSFIGFELYTENCENGFHRFSIVELNLA